MKRVVASENNKKYVGRTWGDLMDALEADGYTISQGYNKPGPWIELRRNGIRYDAEVTKYSDYSYEIMEYNIYESNHNDLVDDVIEELGNIIDMLREQSETGDEQATDIMYYLMQVGENIQQYRSGNYE